MRGDERGGERLLNFHLMEKKMGDDKIYIFDKPGLENFTKGIANSARYEIYKSNLSLDNLLIRAN